jgi:3-dehydroquinate dehydratase / shikimate dehydrogenase
VICCSIAASTKSEALKDVLNVRSKADIIEIRLDYISDLDNSFIEKIISVKTKPLIFTFRKKEEGGVSDKRDEERIDFLKKCVELGADYVDIELSSGKDKIDELAKEKGDTKIIISYHNFEKIPENMDEIYEEIKSTGCDIIKIAGKANTIKDNLQIFGLIKKAKSEQEKIIALCMGEKGEISRILNVVHGSYLTYGYLYEEKKSAPGQISCEQLKRLYRSDKLELNGIKIYGLVGKPVSESRGFFIHNLIFKKEEMNSIYVNFLVDNLEEFILDFKEVLNGFSVTMPYKQEIMKYLDDIDDNAKRIGAVNTVKIEKGQLIGYNTDMYGAIESIEQKIEIKDKEVVMLGAGGAARAIGYGIVEKGGNLVIVNRTLEKGKKLALELNCDFNEIDKIDWDNVNILINTTSVGMMPNINESPIERKYLKNMVVFDAVYNPLITKMLDMSEKNGCEIISGIKMFIYQAARQFEIWSDRKCDIQFIEETVLEHVTR